MALACLLTAVTPAVAAATMDSTPTGASDAPAVAATDGPPIVAQTNTTANASGAGGDAGAGSGGLTLADQSRVTAVQFDRPYLKTTRTEGMTWKTIGPYAVFAVSEQVEAARVTQPNADAAVLDGGHTLRVAYDPDAAPPDGESLYTVELFFADGSKMTLRLLASQTDQIVASAQLKEASSFLDQMKEDAKEHGYEPTIEGITKYHKWEKEQADLFNNLFAPQFEKLFAWMLVTIQTPFAIITIAAIVILVARRLLKTHGAILRERQNGVDLVEQSREAMRLSYLQEQDAADEERLEDVDEIGPAHVYWEDAFGISSVKQLADEVAFGRPLTDDHGNIVRQSPENGADPIRGPDGDVMTDGAGEPIYPPKMVHRGIEDLRNADDLHGTWLEPILRPDMIGDPQAALAHAKRALARMTTHYGQPQYRPARKRVKSMLESMHQGENPTYRMPTTHRTDAGYRYGNTPAGGDD
ncbi:MAG: hypothetical protein ABEJ68_08395 [Halobacteriaceae archaeon]